MKRYLTLICIALTVPFWMDVLPIQAQSTIPDDIHRKMDGQVGTWTFEEWVREDPDSDEINRSGTWTARWLFDDLLEWKGEWLSEGRKTETIQLDAYDAFRGGYGYAFGSAGGRGRHIERVWDGLVRMEKSESTSPDGEVSHSRCRWVFNPDFAEMTEYTCDKLEGGTWRTFRRGNAVKVSG